MRNTQNMTIARSDSMMSDPEETIWSLSGAAVGFLAWLMALGIPFLLYGRNTLLFFLYTWPFFLALLPVAVVVGVALHSLLGGRLAWSISTTLIAVAAMFGLLFLWLLG
ncbi:DUF3561 family protein [Pluralibacter gergoviae]